MIFLGEGVDGYVINNNGNVAKYSIESENLKREFANIKLLPKKDFYINPDDVSISSVSADEEEHIISLCHELKIVKNKVTDYKFIKLNMPLIEGISLEKYLSNTDNFSINNWIDLIKSFLLFIPKVIELNNIYKIYHNDLHFGNMIYNINENKIMMIDFSNMTLNNPNIDNSFEEVEDQILLHKLLRRIIKLSSKNIDIYNYINDFCIINNNGELYNLTDSELYNQMYEIFV